MIGKNPFVAQTNPVTTIKTYLQPIVFQFIDGKKWDPTVGDGCDATSALTRTQNSPIFKTQNIKFGGTSVGTAQYVDAFQRAEFYQQTKPTGINPGYHVKLKLITLAKMTINVPDAKSAEGTQRLRQPARSARSRSTTGTTSCRRRCCRAWRARA